MSHNKSHLDSDSSMFVLRDFHPKSTETFLFILASLVSSFSPAFLTYKLLSANLNASTLLYECPCISRLHIKAKRRRIARMYRSSR